MIDRISMINQFTQCLAENLNVLPVSVYAWLGGYSGWGLCYYGYFWGFGKERVGRPDYY